MSEAPALAGAAPGFAKHPDYKIAFEPTAKRVRVVFGGETIADSTHVMMLHETRHLPVYYFPRSDVAMARLKRTDHSSFCPFKGEASYWSVEAGGQTAENAAWSYESPYDDVASIKDYIAFYWNRMDAWFEEDEEVFVHARDPYKRIDVVESRRPVKVVLGGETVAETTSARFLFETGLPTRYYIPAEDVRRELLQPSDKRTACPYKGTAQYWSVKLGDTLYDDIVWYYPDPIAECPRIKDRLCFFNERVDAIFVDGEEVPKVRTPWSRD